MRLTLQELRHLVGLKCSSSSRSKWVDIAEERTFEGNPSDAVFTEQEINAMADKIRSRILDEQARMDEFQKGTSVPEVGLPNEDVSLYALGQANVAKVEKRLVANYLMEKLPLRNGEGIVIDAGSTCLTLWDCILERIAANLLVHLSVVTNNFRVLEQWTKNITKLPVRETRVELIGTSTFDPSHLAFYGKEAFAQLTSSTFRASTIYIGTSGIEFDPSDGILFSYHGDERERDFKTRLFQTPARRRVILAASAKIGSSSGGVLDLLRLQDLDTRAPIFLVSTKPEEHDPEFERALQVFKSEEMQRQVMETKPQLDFRWIILDPRDGRKVEEYGLGASREIVTGTASTNR